MEIEQIEQKNQANTGYLMQLSPRHLKFNYKTTSINPLNPSALFCAYNNDL
jgi:hypothetical protein